MVGAVMLNNLSDTAKPRLTSWIFIPIALNRFQLPLGIKGSFFPVFTAAAQLPHLLL
jgi:hypothetical protein